MDHNEIVTVSPNPNGADQPISAPYVMGSVYPTPWQSREAEDEGFISPRILWRALSQWWYIALPVALVLATISGATVMLTFTPVYRSTAVMRIASYTPYIAYTVNEQPMQPEEFTETQIELLKSPLVLEQLMADPEIAALPVLREQENPIGWLSDQVKVDQVGNSELYYVYLDVADPDSAVVLVNAILDGYFAVRASDAQSQTQRVLELLNQEKVVRQKEISRLREKMRGLGKNVIGANPITGMPTAGGNNILGPLAQLGDQLSKAQIDRRMSEIEITALREMIRSQKISVADVEVEMGITETQEIRDLRAQIALKKAMQHRVEVAAAAGKDDSGYRRLEREIAQYERSLAMVATEMRPQITESIRTMATAGRADVLKQMEASLEVKSVLEDVLAEQYEQQLAAAGASGDQLMDLEFARAELAREEKVFEMIAERSMALTTESRAPGRVVLLQKGDRPTLPVESLPLRNLAAAIFVSGCLPFGLALAWEVSVKRISDADQLSQHGAISVIGEVAKLPLRFRSIVPGSNRARSLFEESIDSLRVGLVLPDEFQDVKVIAVTSAVHSEGKSSVSSQLAVSIGRSIEERVLLIDGDLRAPDLHHIFDIPNDMGLAAVLDGRADVDEAIITTWSENIHLLPAGQLRKSPHKLMSIGVLNQLLDRLRPRYRYIVIDTPPILSASEALMLAKVADGTVLSTRRNVSREHQVRTAYDRLIKAGAQPMGAVFNGVPTRSYAQTYGNYDYTRSHE